MSNNAKIDIDEIIKKITSIPTSAKICFAFGCISLIVIIAGIILINDAVGIIAIMMGVVLHFL